jgi:hypothetical protein
LDQIGNDLYCYLSTLPEQLTRALQDEKCIAFNTLGYFKYTITHLSKPSVFKETDGIFLKKSRVRIQS